MSSAASGIASVLAPCALTRSALPRLRGELERLRGRDTLTGCGLSLGWVHSHRACTLHNLTLSRGVLSLVLNGCKILRHGGLESVPVEAGGLAFFRAGQQISCSNMPEEGGEYMALTLSFSSDLLSRVRQRVPVDARAPEGRSPDEASDDRRKLMLGLETFLRLLPEETDPTLPLMQQEQVLYQLWRLGVPVFTTQCALVGQIRSLVEEQPDHPWSTGDLAFRLHMTERTLRRQLEKEGTNPSELVRMSRLHVGLDLLMRKNVRVGEVAMSCGYSSQSRFAERFREQFGIPPGEIIANRRVPF